MNAHQLDPDFQPMLDAALDFETKRIFILQSARRAAEARLAREVPMSLSQSLLEMASPGGLSGGNREYFQESARQAGRPYDPHRAWCPFEMIRAEMALRDLNIATGTAGGYLKVGTDAAAYDVLRPFSITLEAGAQILPGLRGDVSISRTASTATVEWLASESTGATPSTPVIAQNGVMAPKTAIGVVQVSKQLSVQANAEAWVRRELLRTAGSVLDQAVINGAGTGGEPLGVLGIDGVGTQSGSSLAYAGIVAMKRLAAVANVRDGEIAFIGTPAVRELLEKREKASGSGMVWNGQEMAGVRAYASTDVPSATLLCGPLSQILVGMWGDGIELAVNPYDATLFKQGVIQVRVAMSVDVAVTCDPAAFTKATSIT